MVLGHHQASLMGLTLTILLGLYFIAVQGTEYILSAFCLRDGAFGSSFFMATSAHGIHVLVGTILLIASLLRLFSHHFVSTHHFGFEARA